jgi:hypothetical protein
MIIARRATCMEREGKGNEQDRSYQSHRAGAAPIRMDRQGKGWLGISSLAEELVSMVVGAVGPYATSPAIFTWMGFNTGRYVVGVLEFLSAVEGRSEARQRVTLTFGMDLPRRSDRVRCHLQSNAGLFVSSRPLAKQASSPGKA